MMIVLGIDPGFGRCGFAVLQQLPRKKVELVSFGVIVTKTQSNFAPRLLEIADDFEALIIKHKPDILSMEDLFFVQNVTTGMQVAQVRGVLLYLAHKHGLKIVEPKPVELKNTFCGNGKATKYQMKKMAQLMFGLEETPKLDDAADAIGAAIFGFSR